MKYAVSRTWRFSGFIVEDQGAIVQQKLSKADTSFSIR